jgi:phenylacetate-CoA ligase
VTGSCAAEGRARIGAIEATMTHSPIPAVDRSKVAGIDWPSLPSVEAMNMLSLQYMLARTQWWRPERLREHQFRQLDRLLAHAVETVPYYRERAPAYGGRGRKRPLSPERWRGFPLLTRASIQQYGRLGLLASEVIPAGHGRVMENTTSGSTGAPVVTQQTELSQLLFQATVLRETLWHRRDLAGKFGAIRRDVHSKVITAEGAHLPDWGFPFAGVYPTGPAVFLHVFLPVSDQVSWLQRERPDYLITFPSNFLAITRYALERGIRLPSVRGLRTVGEVVTPELRAACRECWGVEIDDAYSTQELGNVAYQCPEQRSYHVQSETVLVEIIDDAGRPCPPGKVGRVVLTPLQNFAMPMIRYSIGDYAEFGEPCACGRGLPVLRRILGRTRNMVTMPSGEKRFSMLPGRTFARVPAIEQHQVVQTGLEEIEVRLVARKPLEPAEEDAIRHDIVDQLQYPFRIRFTYHQEIPRSPEGKFEDFRSEL